MALITATIWGTRPERAGHTRKISGDIILSKNSQFPVSAITKYFRTRCTNILVTLSNCTTAYQRSSTKDAGVLIAMRGNSAGAVLVKSGPSALTSGTFVATGW